MQTLTIPEMYMEGVSSLAWEDRLSIAKEILDSFKKMVKSKSKKEDELDLRTCFKGDWAEGQTAEEYADELRSTCSFTRTVDTW